MRRFWPFTGPLLLTALAAAVLAACSSEADPHTEALKIEATAHRLAFEGRHQDAIAEYTRAIEIAPDLAVLYLERGVSYTWTGELQPAIADFDTALGLKPDWAAIYYERGAAFYRLALLEQSEADLRRALDLTSDPDIVLPAQHLLDSIRSGDATPAAAAR